MTHIGKEENVRLDGFLIHLKLQETCDYGEEDGEAEKVMKLLISRGLTERTG